MDRTEQVKRAYAEGAFKALQELGYEKNAAAQFAFKMAEEEVPDKGVGALGGAGLGALGGAGLGAGGAALASILLKKNLLRNVPGLGAKLQGLGAAARKSRGASTGANVKRLLGRLEANPTAASAIGGGAAGLGLGTIGGGLAGGLSGKEE